MNIDADGMILGRMASTAAQELKDGAEVNIVNAEKAVVTGRREEVFERYRKRRGLGDRERTNYPKAPERIVRRTVRGMLPDTAEGREAVKRLRTYRGNPSEMEADETDIKTTDDLQGRNWVTIQEVTDHI